MYYRKFLILIYLIFSSSCGLIISTLIPLNNLPDPTGKYFVGTKQFHWIDKSREEWFSKDNPNDFRELMVQIWYPSDKQPLMQPEPYMDNLDLRIPQFAKQIGIPKFFINQITKLKTQSYNGLDIANDNLSFPVIIFSHGLGGMRVQNTSYIQELVSHGFIVTAMDHTYDANITIFPNNDIRNYDSNLPKNINSEEEALQIRYKQLETRTEDVTFVLNKMEELNNDVQSIFHHKLKLEKVGIFGHSFGGATSISASFHDSRITACISLDGWFEILTPKILNSGLASPIFHLGQEKWKEPLNYKNRDLIIKNSESQSWISTFIESKHFDYMDLPLFTNKTRNFRLSGNINPISFYQCLNEIQISFFNFYIKNKGSFNPKLIAKKIPIYDYRKRK